MSNSKKMEVRGLRRKLQTGSDEFHDVYSSFYVVTEIRLWTKRFDRHAECMVSYEMHRLHCLKNLKQRDYFGNVDIVMGS